MKHTKAWMIVLLLAMTGLLISGCSSTGESAPQNEVPAYVDAVEGAEYQRVILTDKAIERLDIQVELVREEQLQGALRLVVPYSSVIYGLHGETWVYVGLDARTFMREPITVDYIEGDNAVLEAGPLAGTAVASVGVAELYGIDTGVGK